MDRKPSSEEIGRRRSPAQIELHRAATPQHYHDLSAQAANRVSDDYAKRWKRINVAKGGPALYEAAMRIAESAPNAQLATDIFEHIADIYRSQIQRPPGKRPGPHNPDDDKFLLTLYDLVRNGGAPGQTESWSKAELAKRLAGKRWGSASTIERRLVGLVNRRNKQKRTVTK
jgi:hypothetical protein